MHLSGEIHTTVWEYLKPTKCRTARFYMLPKIHKNILPPPYRPIISGNNSPTERVSQFVDHFLRPYLSKIPSYLQDTSHLLNIIKDLPPIPKGSIIFSFDV